jgi:poly(3-hydroxybutyrate) depolymerase
MVEPFSKITVSTGSGHFALTAPRGLLDQEMTVWYHRPAGFTTESAIVIVCHGVGRNADEYRDAWVMEAEDRGFLLLVPDYSRALYPTNDEYNLGNMIDVQGGLNPRDDWTYGAIERIFRAARKATGATAGRFRLYGHSAGAQFVHRMMTFDPPPSVGPVIIANAGWYTLPTADAAFPAGLGGTEVRTEDLAALFRRDLTVLLGEADSDPDSPNLPREPAAMRQGPHRFARGHFYFECCRAEAERIGADFAWHLATAPGIGHSNPGMAPFAARLFFGD